MADLTVAKTILEQLGGAQFRLMTGSSHFIGGANDLTFKVGGNNKGVTHCRIELTSMDTYTVQFIRCRGSKATILSQHADIYFDQLKNLFEEHTGLYVSLHPRS